MKRGESITIERTQSGCYNVKLKDSNGNDVHLIGNAASTIITLANAVFKDECMEIEAASKAASDILGDSLIADMHANPSKYICPTAVIEDDNDKAQAVPSLPPHP